MSSSSPSRTDSSVFSSEEWDCPINVTTDSVPSVSDKSAAYHDVGENVEGTLKSVVKSKGRAEQANKNPRRVAQLPLPNPLPEKVVDRYPVPNRSRVQSDSRALKERLTACFQKLDAFRAFQEERKKLLEARRPERNDALKAVSTQGPKIGELFKQKAAIKAELKLLNDEQAAARAAGGVAEEMAGAGKVANEAVKGLRSAAEVDARIAEYQIHLQTYTMTIAEERDLVKQISFLTQKGRDFFVKRESARGQQKAAAVARQNRRQQLLKQRHATDQEIDCAKGVREGAKKDLNRVQAEDHESCTQLPGFMPLAELRAVQKTIGPLKKKIRAIWEAFDREMQEWDLNNRIYVAQTKALRRKRRQTMQQERRAEQHATWQQGPAREEQEQLEARKSLCITALRYLERVRQHSPEPALSPAQTRPPNQSLGHMEPMAISAPAHAGDATVPDVWGNVYLKVRKPRRRACAAASHAKVASKSGVVEEDQIREELSSREVTAFTMLGIPRPKRKQDVGALIELIQGMVCAKGGR